MSDKVITVQIAGYAVDYHELGRPAQHVISHPELEQALSNGFYVKEIVNIALPSKADSACVIFHLRKDDGI